MQQPGGLKQHWRRGPHLQRRRERFGSHLHDLRSSKGFSLERFSEAIGVSRWTVSEWETGARSIPVEILPTIAKVLSVSARSLVDVINRASLGAAA